MIAILYLFACKGWGRFGLDLYCSSTIYEDTNAQGLGRKCRLLGLTTANCFLLWHTQLQRRPWRSCWRSRSLPRGHFCIPDAAGAPCAGAVNTFGGRSSALIGVRWRNQQFEVVPRRSKQMVFGLEVALRRRRESQALVVVGQNKQLFSFFSLPRPLDLLAF
jgi:hypothetical protein